MYSCRIHCSSNAIVLAKFIKGLAGRGGGSGSGWGSGGGLNECDVILVALFMKGKFVLTKWNFHHFDSLS